MNATEVVLDTLASVLGAPRKSLTRASSADDVRGWDSLAVLNVALALEAALGVTFTPTDVADMTSVEVILEILAEKGIA